MTLPKYFKKIKKASKPSLSIQRKIATLGVKEVFANILTHYISNESIKQKSEQLTINHKLLNFYVGAYLPLSQALDFIITNRKNNYIEDDVIEADVLSTNQSAKIFKILKAIPLKYAARILGYFCSTSEKKQLIRYISHDDEQGFDTYVSEHHIDIYKIKNLYSHYAEKQRYAEYVETHTNEDKAELISNFYSNQRQSTDTDIKDEYFIESAQTLENPLALLNKMSFIRQLYSHYEFMLMEYLLHKDTFDPIEQKAIERIIRRKKNMELYNQTYKDYEDLLNIYPEIPQQQRLKNQEINDRMPYTPLDFENNAKLKEMITRLAEPTCNLIEKNQIKSLYYFCGGECSNSENTKEKIFWNGSAASLKFFFLQLYTTNKKQMPIGSWKMIAAKFLVYSKGQKTEVSHSYLTSGLDPQKLPAKMKENEREKILSAISTPSN